MKVVHPSVSVATALQRVCTLLEDLSGRRFLARGKEHLNVHTRMQAAFALKFASVLEQALYEIIMAHALAAEKLSPGGFDRCLVLLMDELASSPDVSPSRLHETIEPKHPTSIDVDRVVLTHAAMAIYPGTKAMIREALGLAGFAGRIIIEKTLALTPSVELVNGYTFNLQKLLPIDVNIVKPRVFCIDGYLEEVAEIHHLLEAAADAKEPCIMFVRGLADDVKHTLKVNYDRGSLRVIPIGVRFDLEGMNTLIDLSMVAGCDLVSSLKGDLISAIKFQEAPRVDQVITFKDQVVVTNLVTRRRVAAHVAELRARREGEAIDDKAGLFDKRIRSLSPNHVVIRLPDDKDFVVNSQAIDYALRATGSLIGHGTFGAGGLAATEAASRAYASRCVGVLREIGDAVTQDS